jgi:N-carbamoylputrescine amidase
MESIRIGLVVCTAPLGRTRENLARVDAWARKARAAGAKILCFPELNVTGYATGAEAAAFAEPVPGPVVELLCETAARHDTVILAGVAEKGASGQIHASHLALAPNGLLGVYRKLHVSPKEKGVFSAGAEVPLFEAAGIRFGIQLCYDAHFPELSTRMALAGADVIFMPHASPRGTPPEKISSWMRHLPARAFDNGLFVAACNQSGENGSGLAFPGVAVVIGPDGRPLAEHGAGGEDLLTVDLKAEDLVAVRSHPMRYFLPNRRAGVTLPIAEPGHRLKIEPPG